MSRKLYCTVSGQSPLLYHQLFLFFLDAGPLPAIFFARISTFPPDFPPEKGRSDGEKTGFSPKVHRNGWKKPPFHRPVENNVEKVERKNIPPKKYCL